MPDMDGTAFLQLPAVVRGNARVIVLTSYERDEEIYRAVQAGAQGYLIKDASEAEMVSAILRVGEGAACFLPESQTLADRLMRSTLTTRESEVLKELAGGPTNRLIGKRLYVSKKPCGTTSRACLTRSRYLIALKQQRSPYDGGSLRSIYQGYPRMFALQLAPVTKSRP